MCKTIKQKVTLKGSPQIIYRWLTDAKKLAVLSGERARISRNVGRRFSMHNGRVTGISVDLQPGQRIVLAWRRLDFPAGVFSMVTLNLASKREGVTELVLIHRGVPKDLIPDVEKQWRQLYWEKIKAVLAAEV